MTDAQRLNTKQPAAYAYWRSKASSVMRGSLLLAICTVELMFGATQRVLAVGGFSDIDTTFYIPRLTCSTGSIKTGESTNLGKKVYYIGDSVTVGMVKDGGGLLSSSQTKGLSVDIAYDSTPSSLGQDRASGKSVEATRDYKPSHVLTRLNQIADSSDIKNSRFGSNNAEVIVIFLGSNHEANFQQHMVDIVDYLRTANDSARIYLVEPVFKGSSPGTTSDVVRAEINAALSQLKTAGEVNIEAIDLSLGPSLEPDSGDVHYGAKAPILANYIIDKLLEAKSTPFTIPDPPNDLYMKSSEDAAKYAWSYLVNEKHLPVNAAAGLLGNFYAESGINPWNAQNIGSVPEIPQKDGQVDPSFRGSYGYGIAQWTVATHQDSLLGFSHGTTFPPFNVPRSTGNLRYQLDFMWNDLSNTPYWRDVLTKLQDPNVTIEEASDKVLLRYEVPRSVIPPEHPKPEDYPGDIEAYRNAVAVYQVAYDHYLVTKEKSINGRRGLSNQMYQKYNGTSYDTTKGAGSVTACNLATGGQADKYISNCAANNGNAAIACTAINQLLGIPYSRDKRPAATDPDPKFMDCSAFVGVAIYRAFGVNIGGICSIDFLSNSNFETITDIRTITTGDMVGLGTQCGSEGHIAIVVSYDPATKKLITVESHGGDGEPSEVTDKGAYLKVDNDTDYAYEWAVRYKGTKVLQSGAN